MKRCPKCKKHKDKSEFAKDKSRKDGLQPHCRKCKTDYYYKLGKERVVNRTKRRREIGRKALAAYKTEHGCKICGYNKFSGALDLHHPDPKLKEYTLSRKIVTSNFSFERMWREVEKCEILCANCHRETHWNSNE